MFTGEAEGGAGSTATGKAGGKVIRLGPALLRDGPIAQLDHNRSHSHGPISHTHSRYTNV